MNITEIIDPALLEQMVTERFVNRKQHPTEPLIVWNYGKRAQYENTWNAATTTCRGLITDTEGEIVARPFRKFFNLNQLSEIPAGPFRASAKMDGSLGVIYPGSDGYAVSTRGSFTSDQAIWATAWLDANFDHQRAVRRALNAGHTLLVEIIYPQNRIVVDYAGRADLTYLATIDNATGQDVDNDHGWPGPHAATYDGLDLDAIMALDAPNTEGFVLRWEDGTRAKVKFPEYLRLHKILTGVNERTIWEMMSNDHPLDELLELVPDEFYTWVESTRGRLNVAFTTIADAAFDALATVPREAPRREQAEIIKQTPYPGLVFALLDGKDARPMIWRLIRPDTTAPFALDVDA